MTLHEYLQGMKGKTAAVIGLGVSNRPLVELLARNGVKVIACDRKERAALGGGAAHYEALGAVLHLGEGYLRDLDADVVFRTPGMRPDVPELAAAVARGSLLTSEMEVFFEVCPCPEIAVTGSDGKTTTTTIIAGLLSAAGRTVYLGGNIGRALLPCVRGIRPEDAAVVELSSFQLTRMKQRPRVAVVTNVAPNHLDWHTDMQEYIDAKRNILLYQKPGGKAVLGYENEVTRAMAADVKGSCRWFTRKSVVENGGFLRADGMLCMAEGGAVTPVLAQGEVKLRGLHNIENLLAAIAAVWGRVPVEAMRRVGGSFAGVEHRIEPVRTLDGVQWYNDSIASSPTRTIAGLRSFGQKIIVIAGGYDKNIPYEPLAPELMEHVKVLVLMGQTGPKIEAAVRACPGFAASGLVIEHAQDMAGAVALARAAAKPGDIVSLSPASASFDLYPNFEVRGRHYKELVNAL